MQGRPGIPHPAVNGKRTMLQAIIEAPECPDSAYFRWDINADGDFDDNVNGQTEDWRHASKNSGTYYFNLATIDVQLPDARGDFTTYPKIEAKCNGWAGEQIQSKVFRFDSCGSIVPRLRPRDYRAGCGLTTICLLNNGRMIGRRPGDVVDVCPFNHAENNPHTCYTRTIMGTVTH